MGNPSQKTITAATWLAAIGSGSYVDTTWNSSNGWSLPTSGFTSAQLNILAADEEFALNQPDGLRTSVVPASNQGACGILYFSPTPISKYSSKF